MGDIEFHDKLASSAGYNAIPPMCGDMRGQCGVCVVSAKSAWPARSLRGQCEVCVASVKFVCGQRSLRGQWPFVGFHRNFEEYELS